MTRRHAVVVGLLVCLSTVVLLGTLPALTWRLADSHRAARHDVVWVDGGPTIRWGAAVRFTGTVSDPFTPGLSLPVDVTIVNPNPHPLTIQRVRVSITGIDAPYADAAHPCTRLDFEIQQMPRGTLRLPAHRTVDLAGLELPPQSWPQLAMRNRAMNQDGCRGVWLTLGYRSTSARGVAR